MTRPRSKDEFGDLFDDAVSSAFPKRNYIRETIIGPAQMTVVLAGSTPRGAELAEIVKQLVALAGEEPLEEGAEVESYHEHRFLALSLSLPAHPRVGLMRHLIGNPVKIVLAWDEHIFFAAVGESCADTIKRVIDASEEKREEKLPPVMVSLALAPALRLALSQSQPREAEMVARRLEEGDKGHLFMTVKPLDNGLRFRLEGDEGANKLLGIIFGSVVRTMADGRAADK